MFLFFVLQPDHPIFNINNKRAKRNEIKEIFASTKAVKQHYGRGYYEHAVWMEGQGPQGHQDL